MTSKPLVRRTLATLRSAEFGFFGVVVYTRVHTPRFCGERPSAGTLLLVTGLVRPLRMSWLIVGIVFLTANEREFGPQTNGDGCAPSPSGRPRVERRGIIRAYSCSGQRR